MAEPLTEEARAESIAFFHENVMQVEGGLGWAAERAAALALDDLDGWRVLYEEADAAMRAASRERLRDTYSAVATTAEAYELAERIRLTPTSDTAEWARIESEMPLVAAIFDAARGNDG